MVDCVRSRRPFRARPVALSLVGAWLAMVLTGGCNQEDPLADALPSNDTMERGDAPDATSAPDGDDCGMPSEPGYVALPFPLSYAASCVEDAPLMHYWAHGAVRRLVRFRMGDMRGHTAVRPRGGIPCGYVSVAAYVRGPAIDTDEGEIADLELRIPNEWTALRVSPSAATEDGTILFRDYGATRGVAYDIACQPLNPLHPDTEVVAVTSAFANVSWETPTVIAFRTHDGRVWANPEVVYCSAMERDFPLLRFGSTMGGLTLQIDLTWEETLRALDRIWMEEHVPSTGPPVAEVRFDESTGNFVGDVGCTRFGCCEAPDGGSTPAREPAGPCRAHADCASPDEVCARLPGQTASCVDVAVLGPCSSDEDCEADQRESCVELPSGGAVCAPEGLLVDEA